jgi:Flp pilus assembly protein TadG
MGAKFKSNGRRGVLSRGLARMMGRKPDSLRNDVRGLASIEFAFIAGFLCYALLNVTDVSLFLFDQLELNNATQMGAQAAWANCDLNHLPASTKCPNMNSAVTTAVQSTSLGTNVTVASGYPTEGYYCVNGSGALQWVSTVSSPPNNCSGAGNAATVPSDYVKIQTTYTYAPLFPGLSVGSTLPTAITATSWVRLG